MALDQGITTWEFTARLLMFCCALDASITSFLRTETHNAKVGGVTNSAHRFGLGADVVYDEIRPETERREAAERLGLRLIAEGDHDHLQPANWPAG